MFLFFFFNDAATAEIYTLSLHDALPIYVWPIFFGFRGGKGGATFAGTLLALAPALLAIAIATWLDRKSTRLNSSHSQISYAVFCLKKKNNVSNIKFRLDIEAL